MLGAPCYLYLLFAPPFQRGLEGKEFWRLVCALLHILWTSWTAQDTRCASAVCTGTLLRHQFCHLFRFRLYRC
ncbi:hypothetical protein BU26DRAFT_75865 [Trematosphaeria pertusa]|uniref:Uncharacterized protein n=1 Tax=Trematosphaeria pertusa TaxID=390896 RepID=A0A6A6I4U2_9PLEO|nr:uncharacterized protein BU26DRAFT_75865 [Trematosphaeria pertusa]KAF2245048.1 hypothetical protein BU26DRAFT_75865 [Trematosphaeria pertusa]